MIKHGELGEFFGRQYHTRVSKSKLSHIYFSVPFFSSTWLASEIRRIRSSSGTPNEKKKTEAVQQEQLLASQPRAVGSDIGPEAVSDWIFFR